MPRGPRRGFILAPGETNHVTARYRLADKCPTRPPKPRKGERYPPSLPSFWGVVPSTGL